MRLALACLLLQSMARGTDMASVKAEPNLEKRSELALVYAGEIVSEMRKELHASSTGRIREQLRDFEAAVDLSVDSLMATGKNARNRPKYFKRAEQKMRDLNRRIETLQRDMSIDDRPVLEGVTGHVNQKIDVLVNATLRGS